MRASLLLLFLIAIVPVSAVTLVDGSTGQEISIAVVTISDGQERDVLVLPNQPLELPRVDEQTTLLVRANFSSTYDYYAVIRKGEVPKTLVIKPATVLVGQVRNVQDNLLVHAPVRIVCPSFTELLQTDQTGMFKAVLPAERCVVSAEMKGSVGSTEIDLVKGVPARTTLVINYTVQQAALPDYGSAPLLLALVVVIAGAVIGVILWRKPAFTAQRVKSVLKSKESVIVDALVAQGGKATLSSLRSHVHIPRTSLLRTLESLEQRNVLIKREEHGKVIIELLK